MLNNATYSKRTRLLQISARVYSFRQLTSVQLLLYLTYLGYLNICKFKNNPTKLPIKALRKMLMRLLTHLEFPKRAIRVQVGKSQSR